MATSTSDRRSFFNRIRGKDVDEKAEMTFFDHLEALRWHLVRSIIVFLVFAVIIFIYKDWVYDNIILAPAQPGFITYSGLCRFGEWLHLGNAFCMPPVHIDLQVNTVNGTFTSALSMATIGGVGNCIPIYCLGVMAVYKTGPFAQETKHVTGGIFWVSFFFLRSCFWLLFISALYV